MRQTTAICITLFSLGGAALAQSPLYQQPAPGSTPLVLTSPSFNDGGIIPDKYTSAATAPVSPALAWTGAPAQTKAFAIIMHDLDTIPRKTGPDNLPVSLSMAATRSAFCPWAREASITIMS